MSPQDETERDRFEAWVGAAPYEANCSRFSNDESKAAWAGQYRDLSTSLAWSAWRNAAASRDAEFAELRAEVERLKADATPSQQTP